MDLDAFALSLRLAAWTSLLLIPVGVAIGRLLAWREFRGKAIVEAGVTLPLVLPPTVLGYYFLVGFDVGFAPGAAWYALTGSTLNFSFAGLLIASMLVNLPFAVLPMQRAFESISPSVREAAWCSGMSTLTTLWRIDLPLAWPGVLSGVILTFVHTLGEFGVVLMVGGNIPGSTRTAAIAIYDRVQAFDDTGAATMSAVLLTVSFAVVWLVYFLNFRLRRGQR